MKKLTWSCLVAALLAGSSTFSYARDDDNVLEGAYVTAGGGPTRAQFNKDDFGVTKAVDNTDKGYKLSFGFKANRYLGFEVGHTNFGKFVHSYDDGAGNTADVSYKSGGWWYSALAILPFGRYFELFGRLGEIRTQTTVETQNATAGFVAAAGVPLSGNKGKWTTIVGAGAQINFPGQWSLRLEAEDYGDVGDQLNTGRARLRMATASLVYRF